MPDVPGTGRSDLPGVHWLVQREIDVARDDQWLAPWERATLAALRSAKRRRDWRLGRWTAKQALARVRGLDEVPGRELAGFIVASRRSGAPCVLVNGRAAPWEISISHSGDRALCVVAPVGAAVGCDLERVEPRSDDFTHEWFTPAEQAAIGRAPSRERHRTVTLLWSAKESALKALGTGLTVPTDEVSVAADIEGDGWSALAVVRPGTAVPMLGWWRRDAADLITVVTMPAFDRPVALCR